MKAVTGVICAAGAAVIITEAVVRAACDAPVKTDFYSSIGRGEIRSLQVKTGLRCASGDNYVHLGWIADPERENYTIFRLLPDGGRLPCGQTDLGSFTVRGLQSDTDYSFLVTGAWKDMTAKARTKPAEKHEESVPLVKGPWQPFFRPSRWGDYINDHTLWQADDGSWRLAGITSFGRGDYNKEKYFCYASSGDFPFVPGQQMEEQDPTADEGHLAWAPCVVKANGRYYMWYSPHRAYCQVSPDGIIWHDESRLSFLPAYPQFRDPMVLEPEPGQYLMYATARHGFYSSVDIYQSFDAEHWQYAGQALRMARGCEKSGPQASTESPFVFRHGGKFYLSVTYNNNTPAIDTIMHALKLWPGRDGYNDTIIFAGGDPYDFGIYRGRGRSPTLAGTIKAHAPEYIEHGGKMYLTSAGWPWAATLTKGEAAWAELDFVRREGEYHV